MRRACIALMRRDLALALRQGIDLLAVVLFFLAAGVLFPFALGPEAALLGRIAAGIVMAMAALASLLSLDRLFAVDFEDGGLDLLFLSPLPLELAVLAKVAVHWLTTGLPLLLAAPVLGLLLGLDAALYPILLLALAGVTLALSLLGGIGAALTLGARRGGILLAFIVLPLFVPVLILGMGAVSAVGIGASPVAALQLLLALDLALLAAGPWAAAAALRQVLR